MNPVVTSFSEFAKKSVIPDDILNKFLRSLHRLIPARSSVILLRAVEFNGYGWRPINISVAANGRITPEKIYSYNEAISSVLDRMPDICYDFECYPKSKFVPVANDSINEVLGDHGYVFLVYHEDSPSFALCLFYQDRIHPDVLSEVNNLCQHLTPHLPYSIKVATRLSNFMDDQEEVEVE